VGGGAFAPPPSHTAVCMWLVSDGSSGVSKAHDDGEPANADLTTLTQERPVSCRGNTFTEFIDHNVVDRRVLPRVDRSSFRHATCRQADKPVRAQIHDHCPVVVEQWLR
jgi:hypothetical protein